MPYPIMVQERRPLYTCFHPFYQLYSCAKLLDRNSTFYTIKERRSIMTNGFYNRLILDSKDCATVLFVLRVAAINTEALFCTSSFFSLFKPNAYTLHIHIYTHIYKKKDSQPLSLSLFLSLFSFLLLKV